MEMMWALTLGVSSCQPSCSSSILGTISVTLQGWALCFINQCWLQEAHSLWLACEEGLGAHLCGRECCWETAGRQWCCQESVEGVWLAGVIQETGWITHSTCTGCWKQVCTSGVTVWCGWRRASRACRVRHVAIAGWERVRASTRAFLWLVWLGLIKPRGSQMAAREENWGVKVSQQGSFHTPDFHICCILDLSNLFIFLSRTPLWSYFDSVDCLRM